MKLDFAVQTVSNKCFAVFVVHMKRLVLKVFKGAARSTF